MVLRAFAFARVPVVEPEDQERVEIEGEVENDEGNVFGVGKERGQNKPDDLFDEVEGLDHEYDGAELARLDQEQLPRVEVLLLLKLAYLALVLHQDYRMHHQHYNGAHVHVHVHHVV